MLRALRSRSDVERCRGLPKVPLPLRVSGGTLEFLYVDKDIQVSRGNAGGVFVLVRPKVLEELRMQLGS